MPRTFFSRNLFSSCLIGRVPFKKWYRGLPIRPHAPTSISKNYTTYPWLLKSIVRLVYFMHLSALLSSNLFSQETVSSVSIMVSDLSELTTKSGLSLLPLSTQRSRSAATHQSLSFSKIFICIFSCYIEKSPHAGSILRHREIAQR